MSSVKSRKVSLFVIRSIVALTGVLMVAFQNCSRIDTMQVSDLAGKAVLGNEFSENNNSDEVNVQIEQGDGTVIAVDHLGNETVVNPSNDNSNNSGSDNGSSGGGQAQVPVVEEEDDDDDDDDSSDLDVCLPEEQKQKHGNDGVAMKQHGVGIHNTLASFQKIKCKKPKKDRKHDRPRCMDLIREHGATVIDIAKLDSVTKISSLKGKTIIYSSNPDVNSIRSLIVDHAVGKTIVCGIIITRLDIKKGNLELHEGAGIKTSGEIKGRIYKDEESSIDGSIAE